MEFLEQRLRLELQEPAGEHWASLRDAMGRLPANLPSRPCPCSPIHPALRNKPSFQPPPGLIAA